MSILQGLLGITFFILIAWLVSEDRKSISWRIMATGLFIQVVLALLFLYVPLLKDFFQAIANGVQTIQAASLAGTSFVFGYLGGGELPFETNGIGSSFVFGIQSLPVILLVGALSAMLWHWRLLIYVVKGASWAVERAFKVGGAVGVSSAANIFMGMIEAPLLIKPYISKLTRSELFAVMVGGLSTIAGSTMIVIGAVIGDSIPNIFSHLLIASVINAPAAIAISKVMIPGETISSGNVILESEYSSTMDAATKGTSNAIGLLANVIAMLIVFVSLIALVNFGISGVFGENVTLQSILGFILAPVAWLLGISWEDAQVAGSLLGTKVVVNELIAYMDLVALPEGTLSEHSKFIMTYALCSFSNFGSLAIMIGGLSSMASERTSEIAELGLKAILAGFIASSLTAIVVGILSSL